jgi:hypothetical protein
VWAQALIERGMIDGFISGFGGLLTHVTVVVRDHPWMWIVAGLGIAFLIRGGFRRNDF